MTESFRLWVYPLILEAWGNWPSAHNLSPGKGLNLLFISVWVCETTEGSRCVIHTLSSLLLRLSTLPDKKFVTGWHLMYWLTAFKRLRKGLYLSVHTLNICQRHKRHVFHKVADTSGLSVLFPVGNFFTVNFKQEFEHSSMLICSTPSAS